MRWLTHTKIRIILGFVIILAAFTVPLWHVFTYGISNSGTIKPPPAVNFTEAGRQKAVGLPIRITIPSITVDATIEQVGLTAGGSMAAPKQPMDAGWYQLGPRPGAIGSAAVVGHVDWWYGATGVFADLHKVMPGDTIIVQDDTGAKLYFEVREIRRYAPTDDATEVFSSTDGQAHLNLITCNGVWNKQAQQYSERLVVFADKRLE